MSNARAVYQPNPKRRSNCGPITTNTENKVYVLPKVLDEKVARLHLAKIGVVLDELTPAQSGLPGCSRLKVRSNLNTTGTDHKPFP